MDKTGKSFKTQNKIEYETLPAPAARAGSRFVFYGNLTVLSEMANFEKTESKPKFEPRFEPKNGKVSPSKGEHAPNSRKTNEKRQTQAEKAEKHK